MKYRGIFEYEYPTEHKPPVSIDVYLHGDCVKGKIIEWEYRPLEQEPVLDKIRAENEQLRAYITMMQADYEARLKDDLVAMLTELQLEIEELEPLASDSIGFDMCVSMSSDIIQQKINALKGEV